MAKKRLGIVTSSREVGIEYKRQLGRVFGDAVSVSTYSFEENNIESVSGVDTLLISTYSQYEVLKKYLDTNIDIVISELTLSKTGYARLKSFDCCEEVMLVNLNFEMCIETIATLYRLGFDSIPFVPVYPGIDKIPDLEIAVTTGESELVPGHVKKIVDLGHRVINKDTIVDIAVSLGLEDVLSEKRVMGYFDTLVSKNKSVEFLISKSNNLQTQLNFLMSNMDKGFISADEELRIEGINEKAARWLGISKDNPAGKLDQVISELDYKKVIEGRGQIQNQLVKIEGRDLAASVFPVKETAGGIKAEGCCGVYLILESFEKQERRQNKLRLQLADKGHVAKYKLDHIIGESREIEEVKKLILRMGNSNSAVLIMGESGTGKELVAQAIHNASPLRDQQFVAVNCAAIPSNLLESELFGYEKGAFTGASSSGKSGIFELAHNGTLFLDEIGEMPIELQTRLLRVIQEHEVMRVGGDRVIRVDVRLVAATNKDLYQQVLRGEFRKDLYYRLNVLPIHIPPLRERKEDIIILFDYFKKLEGCDFGLSEEVENFFLRYDWNGNIRELRNCVKYLENLNSQRITLEDLPYHMKEQHRIFLAERESSKTMEGLTASESLVMEIFYQAFLDREKLGRRSLSDKAFEKGVFLSEYDMKGILSRLKSKGFINVSGGRGGSSISSLGKELVESNK